MLRLELEDESAHAVFLATAGEDALCNTEAGLAEVLRLHRIWE
jgi:hypothetical protein